MLVTGIHEQVCAAFRELVLSHEQHVSKRLIYNTNDKANTVQVQEGERQDTLSDRPQRRLAPRPRQAEALTKASRGDAGHRPMIPLPCRCHFRARRAQKGEFGVEQSLHPGRGPSASAQKWPEHGSGAMRRLTDTRPSSVDW